MNNPTGLSGWKLITWLRQHPGVFVKWGKDTHGILAGVDGNVSFFEYREYGKWTAPVFVPYENLHSDCVCAGLHEPEKVGQP